MLVRIVLLFLVLAARPASAIRPWCLPVLIDQVTAATGGYVGRQRYDFLLVTERAEALIWQGQGAFDNPARAVRFQIVENGVRVNCTARSLEKIIERLDDGLLKEVHVLSTKNEGNRQAAGRVAYLHFTEVDTRGSLDRQLNSFAFVMSIRVAALRGWIEGSAKYRDRVLAHANSLPELPAGSLWKAVLVDADVDQTQFERDVLAGMFTVDKVSWTPP